MEKRHVQIITDVLKELANAGIDKLASTYLPVETEKGNRKNHRGKRKNRKSNIKKNSDSGNIE